MGIAALIIFLYFLLFFVVGTAIKNNSIVDIGWGPGFVVTAWILTIVTNNFQLDVIVINLLVSIWGLRLGYHIYQRNHGKPEDFRYQKWREEWGKYVTIRAFFQVYMLQGMMMFLIGLSVFSYITSITSFRFISIIGIGIFVIGFLFEVVGDYQLQQHINNPTKKGSLLTEGLWKYTRHPNYFGESFLWIGIFLYAVTNGAPIYGIISPIVITVLVRFVSGVKMLEVSMSKKPGWDEYVHKTNAFIPWFPRK